MIIQRFSIHKFEPQFQNYHLDNYVYYHLSDNFSINDFPEHIQKYILKDHLEKVKLYKENFNDFLFGIWAFIDGYKDNQSLNHLKQKVPNYKAYISDNTVVYNSSWDKKMNITSELCKIFGFYIPESQLYSLKIIS